ncbi:MAG: metallophosphoesterase [Gammaproteobacteria bacterium]|jgi:predicted MPP superfamily phosphohydrolase|nr:metallophosphoesterase [Gammaproteobacteria bacterium]
MTVPGRYPPTNAATQAQLDQRVGRLHLWLRQGIQRDHVDQIFGRGRNFFHIENWYSIHSLIRLGLQLTGLYGRGRRNAANIQVRHHRVRLAALPPPFHGLRLLHLSDIHVDMEPQILQALIERVAATEHDLCVITGDFRARTHGDCAPTLEAMARLRPCLAAEVYGVLGNHDFVELVPGLEDLGIRILLNEALILERDGARLYLAGIDDPHYYRADNLEKAADGIPPGAPAILLSHSPEIYRHAAHAGFRLMLCGHTHGGQICLPGGIALTYNAACPRRLGLGPWRWGELQGYTSAGAGSCVVPVRFNCPPEITVHHLDTAD